MVINNNPSRDRMSPRSTIWGRVKRSHTVDLCPSAPSAISSQWPCTRIAHKCIKLGNAQKKGNATRDSGLQCRHGYVPLKQRYASILFDTGTDRSFISSAFSSLIDIAQTPLENSYYVELADGKIVGVDTIMRGCTLNFLNHPFNIDLMPVELGSFDVIIGMDWLRRECNGSESRLTIILCSKAQEYMAKGCQTFLAQISAKKEEDKSEGKQLKDVPIVRDFPEVFLEGLVRVSSGSTSGLQIELIFKGDAPVARAPYRIGSRNEELDPRYFKKIEFELGYHQLRVREQDIPKTAFQTRQEGKRATTEHLKAILELLKNEKLYAKFSKCEFWIPKVQFLGHIIDSRGIHVDPTKIESIKDWASPKTPTEIR
ncbi:putative reverse transcriptase domain-containing protein [Tanacetum coccineum]